MAAEGSVGRPDGGAEARVRPPHGEGNGVVSREQVRGVVARRIVQDDLDPDRPEELAEALAPHFDVELRIGAGTGNTHELRVVA